MATRTDIRCTVQSRDNRSLPETAATIVRIDWDRQERLKNAFRIFGLMIFFSFISIFVPILHFFLVPVFFITSFVLFLDRWQETHRNGGGKGQCPKCHQDFTVQASKWKDRITNNCDHCHEDLEVRI